MYIHLLRHGQTQGNAEKRYIGSTDEPLLAEAAAKLQAYPEQEIAKVYASPLLRCRQSAALLFPGQEPIIVQELRECAFGSFENKNYAELKNRPEYQAWLEGKNSPPGGEDRQTFQARCILGFEKIVTVCLQQGFAKIAVITHGGVIMHIMASFAWPAKVFYDWQPPNSGGFLVQADRENWLQTSKVRFVEKISHG